MEQGETHGFSIGRRQFVRGAAATLGLAGVASAMGCAPRGLVETGESTGPSAANGVIGPDEQIFQGCCHSICGGSARLNVHVRDGKIVKTSKFCGDYDTELDHICTRGLVHAQRTYAPERVQYPMRRAEGTERGAGEWERLTWDEALAYIVEKWKGYIAEYGPSSVGICYGSGSTLNNQYIWTRLAHAFGGTHWMVYDCMAALNVGATMFGRSAFLIGNDAYDILNSKNIFVWADNKSVTNFWLMPLHWQALDKGAKMVVIDPNYTDLAAKADLWVPIRPGSDGALALAMIKYYIDHDKVATDWLLKNSVSPFLVREDTLTYMHAADIGKTFSPADAIGEESAAVASGDTAAGGNWTAAGGEESYVPTDEFGRPVDYLVVSADGTIDTVDVVADPQLDAAVEVNGVACKTAFALLRERVAEWTLERASAVCDIPVDTIAELAELYADGPSRLEYGFGVDRYCNGGTNTVCLYAMAMVAGQVGQPGASIGGHNGGAGVMHERDASQDFLATWYPPNAVYTSLMIPEPYLGEVVATGMFNGNPLTVKSIISYCNNHVATSPHRNEQIEAQKGVELLICCDTFMTETARYSDVVLPICYNFEYETMTTKNWLNEKAIEPLFEARTDVDVACAIGRAMGFEGFELTEQDFLQMYYENEACKEAGYNYEKFKQDKYPLDPGERVPFVYGNVDYGTVFTNDPMRATFFFENPAGMFDQTKEIDVRAHALPFFKVPNEAWPETVEGFEATPAAEKHPLYLISPHDRVKAHTQFALCPILTEIRSEPSVNMNAADAASRGIAEGDYVRVFNDRGEFKARAHIDAGVRPGVATTEHGWWADQYADGNRVNSLNSDAMDHVWPTLEHFDVLCEVEKTTVEEENE